MTIHIQLDVPGWPEAVERLPAGAVVKAVNIAQYLPEARARNRDVYTIYRQVNDHQYYSTNWDEMIERWRNVFPTFIDDTFRRDIAEHTNAIEGDNEYLSNDMDAQQIAARATSARAAAHVWATEYRTDPDLAHIELVICNTAVGNSIPVEFARICEEYWPAVLLGYHPYWLYENGERHEADWPYLAGRFDMDEFEYEEAGIDMSKIRWAFTETGPFASTWDGWLADNCLGGDFEAYKQAFLTWLADVEQTPAYQQVDANGDPRIKGIAYFTTARGMWERFIVRQPEMNELADLYRENWNPGTAPAPPPDEKTFDQRMWDRSVEIQVASGISLNPDALLQGDIAAEGQQIVHSEKRMTNEETGERWGFQAGEHLRGNIPRRVYRTQITTDGAGNPVYGPVEYYTDPYAQAGGGTAAVIADRWDAPIGTPEQRDAPMGDGWPGAWEDANPFGNRYSFGSPPREAYHTGADLNLNDPYWDADRHMPVFAPAEGVVTFAGRLPGSWGKVVVIEHREPAEGPHDDRRVYSRLAHLEDYSVAAGQRVRRGQQIARIGRPPGDPPGPYHLHFDISPTAILKTEPWDWPGLTWSRLEENYTDPLDFIRARHGDGGE